jgi:hypothetical protein
MINPPFLDAQRCKSAARLFALAGFAWLWLSVLPIITLKDYGLLSPCLRFTHAITRIGAKLGADGRLTLSVQVSFSTNWISQAWPGALEIRFFERIL